MRAYDKGPFSTFAIDAAVSPSISGVTFSNDGKLLLVSTPHGSHLLLDAFNGALMRSLTGHTYDASLALEACFSPDSELVLAGTADGGICRWEVQTGQQLPTLSEHAAPVRAIRCNPTRMLLAAACGNGFTSLWCPTRP